MKNLGQLSINKNKIGFVVLDVQEKFVPVIKDIDKVIKNINIMSIASEIFKLPVIFTEQNPNGLGKTTEKIYIPDVSEKFNKTSFSAFGDRKFHEYVGQNKFDTLIMAGIEAHICVLQTVLDALQKGIQVHVIADAISSRTKYNKKIAIDRMVQVGAYISSTEMVLFQLLKDSNDKRFKAISELVK